jgi:hypothetical protein
MELAPVHIGDTYRFIPSAFIGEKSAKLPGKQALPRAVTGRVSYINHEHRFFQVTYELNGYSLKECIKF